MSSSFRFAVVSDPHIALPHTIWDHPKRFHLVEVSIPALETVLQQLEPLDLDFLLLPGDLTQHGEIENHTWLAQRLAQLPYPVYVVPGNHDVVQLYPTQRSIGLADFPRYYEPFGYSDPTCLYYSHEILPGVRLIGLNSNAFDAQGQQIGTGHIDAVQLNWLKQELSQRKEDELVLVMVHHNLIEHLPGQSRSLLGRRYMTDNAPEVLRLLRNAGVQLLFTGHLHVQDIAQQHTLYEITTGSLVSYPHPYRLVDVHRDERGNYQVQIQSRRVRAVPGWSDLQHTSREWMAKHSHPFMVKLLTQPPLVLPLLEAERFAPDLRYFWADIANGDALFDFDHFPATVHQFLSRFGAVDPQGRPRLIDNDATLVLHSLQVPAD
ncbi:MAG: metallophosphoesterase [Synechococcales cyanobacterium M58_A2018_015]|nr:metallophosphoesterase [Synechococcales cyanobacterium M58_A2018_015]